MDTGIKKTPAMNRGESCLGVNVPGGERTGLSCESGGWWGGAISERDQCSNSGKCVGYQVSFTCACL